MRQKSILKTYRKINFLKYYLFCLIIIFFNCWNAPAVNTKYDFSQINNIKLKKITDHSYKPGSGQIMEDNLSFMFMKHGYDVSQTEKNGTIINLNENAKSSVLLTCTLTEFTDRETILVTYRIEDRGSIETIITQSTEADKNEDNAIATT